LSSRNNDSLRRLLTFLPVSQTAQVVLWIGLCTGLVIVCAVRARRAVDIDNHLAAITLVMCLGAAVSPISWAHHLYFLLPALLLLIGRGRNPWRLALSAGLAWMLFETTTPGQHPLTNIARAVALVLVVVLLPLDARHRAVSDDRAIEDPVVSRGGAAGSSLLRQVRRQTGAGTPGWREWAMLGAITTALAVAVLVIVQPTPPRAASVRGAVLGSAESTRWSCDEAMATTGSTTWVSNDEGLDRVHLPVRGRLELLPRGAALFTAPGRTVTLDVAKPCRSG
jgi:hypothetical protein